MFVKFESEEGTSEVFGPYKSVTITEGTVVVSNGKESTLAFAVKDEKLMWEVENAMYEDVIIFE